MQDKELIEKIQNDDNNAFKLLIDKHKANVFKIAIGFLHDTEQAEDIVQEVFIKFWQIRKDFELTAKFSTWLYRVTANKSINQVRRNKFSTVFSNFFSSNDESDDENSEYEQHIPDNQIVNFDDTLKNEQIKKALKISINSLVKNQRIAFVLNKYQNLSYKEISEVMDLTVSSVESIIHRAKQNLQKKLLKTYTLLNN